MAPIGASVRAGRWLGCCRISHSAGSGGSKHAWLKGRPPLDLIVARDDATSTIYSAFLVAEENAASTFLGLPEVFGAHGLPLSLTTDRAAHYFYPPKAPARSTARN